MNPRPHFFFGGGGGCRFRCLGCQKAIRKGLKEIHLSELENEVQPVELWHSWSALYTRGNTLATATSLKDPKSTYAV